MPKSFIGTIAQSLGDLFNPLSLTDQVKRHIDQDNLERARSMIKANPGLLARYSSSGESLINHTILTGNIVACEMLIDLGANPIDFIEYATPKYIALQTCFSTAKAPILELTMSHPKSSLNVINFFAAPQIYYTNSDQAKVEFKRAYNTLKILTTATYTIDKRQALSKRVEANTLSRQNLHHELLNAPVDLVNQLVLAIKNYDFLIKLQEALILKCLKIECEEHCERLGSQLPTPLPTNRQEFEALIDTLDHMIPIPPECIIDNNRFMHSEIPLSQIRRSQQRQAELDRKVNEFLTRHIQTQPHDITAQQAGTFNPETDFGTAHQAGFDWNETLRQQVIRERRHTGTNVGEQRLDQEREWNRNHPRPPTGGSYQH